MLTQAAQLAVGSAPQGRLRVGIVSTPGNLDAHVVLRGGKNPGPNYKKEFVDETVSKLTKLNAGKAPQQNTGPPTDLPPIHHNQLGHQTSTASHDEALHHLEEKRHSGIIPHKVVIDCSHGNSQKDYRNQHKVLDDICAQMKSRKDAGAGKNGAVCYDILGVMIESNIVCGNQSVDAKPLVYGKSVTDACVDLAETKVMLEKLAAAVRYCRGETA